MLRIGIEAGDLLRPRLTGMARYTQCLLSALSAEDSSAAVQPWAPLRRALGLVKSPTLFPVRFFSDRKPQSVPDIFHATACVFPKWKSPIEIATVHDLFAIRAELNPTSEEIARRTAYIARADRIICVSRHTRADLHERLNIPEYRTAAIPLAADERFRPASEAARQRFRQRYGLPAEFLLFVGRYRANKNLERLLQAFARSNIDLPFYIAGALDNREYSAVMQAAKEAGCEYSVGVLRTVRDDDLPTLLSCASAMCLPSTFEGFGLPIVEAMACGTPVLTSAGRATEETAGGHAVLVNPESVESIMDGLIRVLAVTQEQRDHARAYAARRTWKHIAAETWQVYSGACREIGAEASVAPLLQDSGIV